jgi:hypothetical protein
LSHHKKICPNEENRYHYPRITASIPYFFRRFFDIFEIKQFPPCEITDFRIENDVGTERLEIIVFRPANPLPDRIEILFGMDAWHHGRTEFVWQATFLNKFHALPYQFHIDLPSHGERIFFRRMLHIHRDMIDELSFQNFPQHFRSQTIRIELHEESHALHALEERDEVGLNSRLSARHADPIEEPLSLLQKSEKLILIFPADPYHLRTRVNEIRIVTERTAEITADREHGRRDLPGIIDERQFLETANQHS